MSTGHRRLIRPRYGKGATAIRATVNETAYLLGAGFRRWSQPWSQLGLWLALWDDRGECLDEGQPTCPLWSAIARHAKGCRPRLAEIARQTLQHGPAVSELDPCGGIQVFSMPVLCRQRTVGVITACALTRGFLDQEALARFCSRHELDFTLLSRLAAGGRVHQDEDLGTFAEILSRQAEALTGAALARRDIEDLSSQLAQAYEQFHLLYRASADMTLSRKPILLFEKLCQDLLEATVVESFAAILLPAGEAPSRPRVVIAGPLEVPREDLIRLYEQARFLPARAGSAIVLNDLGSRPELAWAGTWLSQLVLLPLSRNERTFGGIMAINRRDGLDFGSEEIQFINAVAERSSAFLENVRLYDDLEQLFMGMLHALVSSIDAKDPYTCGHSQRVAWLSRHIAGLAGIAEAECQRVYLSGLLHDVGKIGVSEAVLRKPGLLTPDEFEEMKRHPEIGADILQGVRQVDDVIPGVLHHHDRFDGKGYPFSLEGEEIPLLGRIVGLADSFDAITTNRTYRDAQSIEAAADEIRRCSGTQFDPILADLFLRQDLHEINGKMARSGRAAMISE